jgi:cytochrome P450
MPANTTITYLPLLTQRSQALWGDDADEFDPERWINPDRVARFTADPMMFTPFSAGPRIVSVDPPVFDCANKTLT